MGNMKSCQKCREKGGEIRIFRKNIHTCMRLNKIVYIILTTDQQMLASITARGTAARRALLAGSFLGWITLNTDSTVASTK